MRSFPLKKPVGPTHPTFTHECGPVSNEFRKLAGFNLYEIQLATETGL